MQRKDEEMELQFFWTNNHRYSEPDHQYQSCLCYGKGLFNHKSLKDISFSVDWSSFNELNLHTAAIK